jgi:hypothetical protein
VTTKPRTWTRAAIVQRGRRWFGEFLVVVLGVFVALAADRWQAASSARDMERAYLQRLRMEIAEDTTRLSLLITRAQQKQAALKELEGAMGAAPWNAAALGQVIRTSLLSLEQDFRTTTYEDLLSTGRWSLLRNPEMRDAIISYFEHIERYVPRIGSRESDYQTLVVGHVLPSAWSGDSVQAFRDLPDRSVLGVLRDSRLVSAISREYYYSAYAQRYFALIRQRGVEAIRSIEANQ